MYGWNMETRKGPLTPGPGGEAIPTACIKRRGSSTYCDRAVNDNEEFVFVDAAYAARNYRDSNVIRACAGCVEAVEKAGILVPVHIAPMATRGVENNR